MLHSKDDRPSADQSRGGTATGMPALVTPAPAGITPANDRASGEVVSQIEAVTPDPDVPVVIDAEAPVVFGDTAAPSEPMAPESIVRDPRSTATMAALVVPGAVAPDGAVNEHAAAVARDLRKAGFDELSLRAVQGRRDSIAANPEEAATVMSRPALQRSNASPVVRLPQWLVYVLRAFDRVPNWAWMLIMFAVVLGIVACVLERAHPH